MHYDFIIWQTSDIQSVFQCRQIKVTKEPVWELADCSSVITAWAVTRSHASSHWAVPLIGVRAGTRTATRVAVSEC